MRKTLRKIGQKCRIPGLNRIIGRLMGDDDRLLGTVIEGLSPEVMDQLSERSKTSAGAARAYVMALQKLGREPEAQHFLAEARSELPENDGLRFQADALARHRYEPLSRAYSLLSLADLIGARQAFAVAVEEVGRRLPAESLKSSLCGSGWVEMSAGIPAAALEFFSRAIRVDPQHMDAHYGAASAHRALGARDRARPIFAVAANLNYLAPAPLALIGWCHYEVGKFGPAFRAFRAAQRRNSLDLESVWGWAWSLWRLADPYAGEAFVRACEVGWHSSGNDLLMLAKNDENYAHLLPSIVASASVVAPHLSGEAASSWIAQGPSDAVECAVRLRRAGLHQQLIDWVQAQQATGALVTEALRSAMELGDEVSTRDCLKRTESDCPPIFVGRGYELLGEWDEARSAFERAVAEGDLAAPSALEDLERRIRFRSLQNIEEESVAGHFDEAEIVKQMILARREIGAGEIEAARTRLGCLNGERARGLLETIDISDNPQTGPGALAAYLQGRSVDLAAIPRGSHLEALSTLKKGESKGRLSKRQVRSVLRLSGQDPEDALLTAASRQALSLAEKLTSQ